MHQRTNNSECNIVAMRKDTAVHEKEKGPSLEIIQWEIERKNDRNPNAPTSEDVH